MRDEAGAGVRNRLSQFYYPTKDQYDRLWKEGIFVLDANVLLQLYRLPVTPREEALDVLEGIKERLWMPFHAALEFQVNRMSAATQASKLVLERQAKMLDGFKQAEAKLAELQIEKLGVDVDGTALLVKLQALRAEFEAAGKKIGDSVTYGAQDSIRDRLDVLLDGRVGEGPTDRPPLMR